MPNRNKQCKNNVESKQRKNNVDLRQTIVHSTKRAMDQRLGRRCAGSLNPGDQNSDSINATYDGQPLCGASQHDLFPAPAQSFAHARAFRTTFPVCLFACLFALSSSSSSSSVVFMCRAARRASCYVFFEACWLFMVLFGFVRRAARRIDLLGFLEACWCTLFVLYMF